MILKRRIVSNKLISFIVGCTLTLVSVSCVDVDLLEMPNNKVNIKLPPSSTAGSELYNVEINGQKLLLGVDGNLPELFPGTYPLLVYSSSSSIHVVNGIAEVDVINGHLNSFPDWFYSTFTSLRLESNSFDNNVIELEQQVRLLDMRITPSSGGVYDRISAIEGRLTGVAGRWDLKKNVAVGPAMEVPVRFVKQNDGSWLAQVRLIGVFGNKQELIAEVKFMDRSNQLRLQASHLIANQREQSLPFQSNLTEYFDNFNTGKNSPFILSGLIDLPTESGFVVSINDWKRVNQTGVAW